MATLELAPESGVEHGYQQQLAEIAALPDVNEQVSALFGLPRDVFVAGSRLYAYQELVHRPTHQEFVDAMGDFATDGSGDKSLVARITALQVALDFGYKESVCDFSSQYWAGKANTLTYPVTYGNDAAQQAINSWRSPFGILMKREHVNSAIFWGEPGSEYDYGDPDSYQDAHPSKALLLLNEVIRQHETGELAADADRFLPLARDVQTALAHETGLRNLHKLQPITEWKTIRTLAMYARYGTPNHQKVVEFLEDSSGAMDKYKPVLSRLIYETESASQVFPDSQWVKEAFSSLVADAFFAVMEHEKQGGNTSVRLPLNDRQDVLPLVLKADDPLELLQVLQVTCKRIRDTRIRDETIEQAFETFPLDLVAKKTMLAVDNPEFHIYRLYDFKDVNAANVYIRPRGSHSYDDSLEYGRNGEGVEASISYVVDPYLQAGELIELGKHLKPGPDSRISIRLDREGIAPEERQTGAAKDPTQERGTLSLDVGSVLGNDEWLGTRLGRFLAWGNYLRTASEGQATQLNHVTKYFSPDMGFGTAEHFARSAERLIRQLERKRLSLREIQTKFSGRLVLNGDLAERE